MRLSLIALFGAGILAAASPPQFVEQILASDLKGGYQVVVADLNHDGRPDLIALASGLANLLWFENPGSADKVWPRHIVASNLTRMINCAAYDVDGDGIPEIALASEFANQAKNSIGIVSIVKHNGDPREPWVVQEIDRLTTSHRLRWADPDGSGKKVLINAPLTGPKAEPPAYADHVPLVFYRPGEWKRELISEANEGVQHGIYIEQDKAHGDSILTASFSGIHMHRLNEGHWLRTELEKGSPLAPPRSGTSDVAVGYLRKKRFLASIEPWHGNEVVVYNKAGQRNVIDDSLVDGHTIVTADLDQDGNSEIIAGFRGKGRSVYVYSNQHSHWVKTKLDDGGMAAGACAVADLDGDGRIDVTCIGSATTNLKIYWNRKR